MGKNRQQKLQEQKKRKRLEERKAKKRMDTVDCVVTFVYDRLFELVLLPFIQKEFKFDDAKMQLYRDKLAEHEIYNEMYRTNEPIDVEKVKKWRPDDKGYRMIVEYTVEKAREILWFIGYTPKQLEKKFDAKLPPFPEWDELFEKT
ncbi:hypothetical protein [Paenibacillus sp. Pae108]|uniref:hypothetical protein n=1 Tax=Paenibacillus sp. Pae108 TaxID=2926019 RepID=UPI002118D1F2|nr:hypothetical protein [Paenibacillus sp. Pae108]